MNSLRPLVTITILAVIGAFLYRKINEGPTRPDHGESEAWIDPMVEGVPPIATTIAPPPGDTIAAAASATQHQPSPVPIHSGPATNSATNLPDIPAIPQLPEVQSHADAVPSATAANNSVPVTLPDNIPSARYPGTVDNKAMSDTADNPGDALTNSVPIDPAAPTDESRVLPPDTLQTASPTPAEHENAIATDNAMAAIGFTNQAPPAHAPRVGDATEPPLQQATPSPDVSAAVIPTAPSPTATTTSQLQPAFAEAWPGIQAALERGELARAHQLLSAWYGDESLKPDEAERVDTLLGQLAGTVVYSTEHQLEPAYVVREGDTLDSIARQYNVPWQLLAKINGIPSVSAVQPGQQLKVLRGPFTAVVELRRSQLTLMLDGRYAGRFPIVVPDGANVTEGRWMVDQKLAVPSAGVAQAAYASAPAAAAVDRSIVLKGEGTATSQPAATAPTLTIASNPSPAGPTATSPAIRISPQDAEELADILSIGSRVVVQR